MDSLRALRGAALAAAWLAVASPGSADPEKVPDPRYSTVTPILVGDASGDAITTRCPGTSAPSVGFVVQPRTIGDTPLLGVDVEIAYGAASGLRFDQVQDAGCTLDCVTRVLHEVTDASGTAVFHPRFGGFTNGAGVTIGANGVVLAIIPARSTDMDAQGGSTGLGDLELFARAYGASATAHPEADFDGSGGLIGLGDLAIFAHEFASGAQATYCP